MGHRGFFLTLEGTDGVGKTTHARLLAPWLASLGWDTVVTREPGAGGPVAEKIRHLLLDPAHAMKPLTELFLYEAARVEHVENVIRPALKRGAFVLCDRFTDATHAYQGAARGLSSVPALNRLSTGGLVPDLTLLLELPADRALARATGRNGAGDRLENEGALFLKRVRLGYLRIARQEPRRVQIVRVQTSVDDTQALLRAAIERKLHGSSRSRKRPSLSL